MCVWGEGVVCSIMLYGFLESALAHNFVNQAYHASMSGNLPICTCTCMYMCDCLMYDVIYSPQELEDTLLLDCAPTPSALLVELFCTFLNGIVDKDIT